MVLLPLLATSGNARHLIHSEAERGKSVLAVLLESRVERKGIPNAKSNARWIHGVFLGVKLSTTEKIRGTKKLDRGAIQERHSGGGHKRHVTRRRKRPTMETQTWEKE